MYRGQRCAVVTGGNRGIGLGIVKLLAKKFDGQVILCSRNIYAGHNAVDIVKASFRRKPVPAGIMYHQLDVANSDSIDNLKLSISERFGGLDILINNAAIKFKKDCPLSLMDQVRNTMLINFFAPMRMIYSLLPLFRPHTRVVNVTCSSGLLVNVPSDDLKRRFTDTNLTIRALFDMAREYISDVENGRHIEKGWPLSPYITSKVFVMVLSSVFDRHLFHDPRGDIVFNSVNPGYTRTDLTDYQGLQNIEEASEAPVYCALLPHHCIYPKGTLVWCNNTVVAWWHYQDPRMNQYLVVAHPQSSYDDCDQRDNSSTKSSSNQLTN